MLLHVSLYPHDAFEYGLYAQPLVPLEGEDVSGTDDDTLDPFAQRAKIGARLTEQERRLLERLRGGNR
ncbi:MAG: hypothetical protein JNM10_08995 [Planctomycetia bacterium]|nr:hypothetical protein [Planctomycetia bacterium]